MVAFGITLASRYAKADELIEMLQFSKLAASADIQGLVSKLFYDSKACCCSFTFTQPLEFGGRDERALFDIAIRTIGQFDWFDTVHHRDESLD